MSDPIEPLAVVADDLVGWRDRGSWQFRLARFWVRHAPRAKGWFPRQIGRRFGNGMRDTIRTGSGAVLAVEPCSLDTYCAVDLDGGYWEREVLEMCCRLMPTGGGVFYDIGANVGVMSLEVAKRFGDAVRVNTFEPQPPLAKAIAVSAALGDLPNLAVFPVMLGDHVGEAELFVGSHSTQASAVSRERGASALRCVATTLDRLVDDGTLAPPDVIKIDVEGGELGVFRGAARTIAAHRPAIVFESDRNAARFGYSREQLCGFLRETGGYRFYAIRGSSLIPLDGGGGDASEETDKLSDFVAIREEIDAHQLLRAA